VMNKGPHKLRTDLGDKNVLENNSKDISKKLGLTGQGSQTKATK